MPDPLDLTRFHPPDMMPLAEMQREQDRDERWQKMREPKDAIIDLGVSLGWDDHDFIVLAWLAFDQVDWQRHGSRGELLYSWLAAMKEEVRCGQD